VRSHALDAAVVLFFFQAEDGIRDGHVTGVQTCALPIYIPIVDTSFSSFMSPAMTRVVPSLTITVVSALEVSTMGILLPAAVVRRSEERRVGKECSARGGAEEAS